MKIKNIYIAILAAFLTLSCGAQKSAVRASGTSGVPSASSSSSTQQQKMQFIQRVSDGALYQKNLVSELTFTVNTGKKDITVPGLLHMRKDEVIRIQLLIPLIRSEVGRIEFTKDYVLFIDRSISSMYRPNTPMLLSLETMVLTSIRYRLYFGTNSLFQDNSV